MKNDNMGNHTLMTLDDFRSLPTTEILKRINIVYDGGSTNYSSPDRMKENGYAFSWSQMREEALKRGLVQRFVSNNEAHLDVDVPEIEIELNGKESPIRKSISVEQNDWERIEKLSRNLKRKSDKSALINKALQIGIEAVELSAKHGKVRFTRKVPCINLED